MLTINNLEKWNSEPYCEIGQSNPIRWMNLKPVGEDIYEPVSYWWKCKDFLNDAITAKHLGKTFSIYGFQCNPAIFFAPEQEDMFLLLKNVLPSWYGNIEVVNEYLLSQGFPSIQYQSLENNRLFIQLPSVYLHNTMFISQVTLFIRMANIKTVHESMEGLSKDPDNSSEKVNYEACMKKPLGEFPEELLDYIWYYDSVYNCKHGDKNQSIMTSKMHNCGVVGWGWL